MAKKHLNAAILKSNLSNLRYFLDLSKCSFGWKLTLKSRQNLMFNKVTNVSKKSIRQYINYLPHKMHCTGLILWQIAFQCGHLKVKIKQILRFLKSCLELYPGSDPLTLYLYITLEFFAVFMRLCQHLKAANLNSHYSITAIIKCLKIKSV